MLDCHKKSVCRKDCLCLVCNEKNKASCSFKCSNWFVKQIWLLQRCLRQLRHRPMWKTTDWTPKPRSPDFIICTEAMRTILTSCFRHSADENQEITNNLWSLAKTYSSKTSSHIYYDVQTSIWIYPWISSVSTYTPKWYNFVLSEEFQEKLAVLPSPTIQRELFPIEVLCCGTAFLMNSNQQFPLKAANLEVKCVIVAMNETRYPWISILIRNRKKRSNYLKFI